MFKMFYKQFLAFTNVIDKKILDDFDFWLAILPDDSIITTSQVSCKFNIAYSIAEILIDFSFHQGILDKRYSIICPNEECNLPFITVEKEEVYSYLGTNQYCHNCDNEYIVTSSDIYVVYVRRKKPNVSEHEIKDAIFLRLGMNDSLFKSENENFQMADSLSSRVQELYDVCYFLDESAYEALKKMREALDFDYGKDTTAKGKAYEKLVVRLFGYVKSLTGTHEIRTYTNQFDCTISSPITTPYLSIFQKLTPYFIAECKNEKDTPSNTYFHKLSDIMSTNEAQVGIVFSRKKPSQEDMNISREQFLLNRNIPKQRYMISMSDTDLDAIINNRVNLLAYLDYKILEMTTNARNATYDMFIGHVK